ncbi:MAG: Gfo/Idh/MocA family protein [Caulobacteraceae bacterium]
MSVKRIGVIGLGQRTGHLLGTMREVGWAIQLEGFVDPEPVGASILAEAGISPARRFASAQDLLVGPPLDLVMIGSPNHLHLEHLLAACEASTPIFVEKPIVRTAEESFALAKRLAEEPAPPIFVGLVMRSMPLVKEMLARVRSGELGEIVSIDATEHLPVEHGAYLARNWRRRAQWGGSFLLDKVCHDFDIFSLIAGSRAMRAASFGGRRIFHPARCDEPRTYENGETAYAMREAGWAAAPDAFTSDMDVNDFQTATLQYASGAALAFHSNTQVSLVERRWYVAGTTGTLLADLSRNKLMVRRSLDRRKPERMSFEGRTLDGHNGADEAMVLDLLAAIEGRADFPAGPVEALEAGLTVMALDEAQRRGAVVDLAPTWERLDPFLAASGQRNPSLRREATRVEIQ